MTEEYIYNTALAQSAVDLGCSPDDFIKNENTVVPSRRHYGARKYLSLPFVCNLVTSVRASSPRSRRSLRT